MRRTIAALAGLTLLSAALALAPSAEAAGVDVVVPNASATTDTFNANAFPFHCGGASLSSQRYQQQYDAGEFPSAGAITTVSFRTDGAFGSAFGPTTLPGVTITLSTSTATMGAMSSTFADNVGSDVATVYSGDLVLSSAASGGPPHTFDVTIPLQHAFNYNPANGNLLLDVSVPTCVVTTFLDVADLAQVDKLYSFSSASLTGNSNPAAGLVTQFTFTPPGSDTTPPDVAFTD